ncbi:Homeodomain-like domain-containing protein [Segatella bryantii]|jgi:IS30 family transposase|nr:Homeodomain-like domain-containing protein [Segatella bryantii]
MHNEYQKNNYISIFGVLPSLQPAFAQGNGENAEYHKRRNPGNRAIKAEVKAEAIRLLKEEQWSPEQISGHLAKYEFISHESIYRII